MVPSKIFMGVSSCSELRFACSNRLSVSASNHDCSKAVKVVKARYEINDAVSVSPLASVSASPSLLRP